MNKRKRGGLVIGMILAIIACCAIQAQPGPGGGPGNGDGPGHGDKPGKGPKAVPDVPPTAEADAATTPESTPVTIDVAVNDTDDNNNINRSTVDLNPPVLGTQGTLSTADGLYTVDAQGIVTFTPATDFVGLATIQYTISDSTALTSNVANINVTVTAVNTPPVAANDSGATTNDKEVEINILANDTDGDGTIDTSKVDINLTQAGVQKSIDKPEGKWSVNKGVVKYKPKDTFVGAATLNYVVYDNENAASNTATVSITVTASNKAPVAVNDTGGTTLNKAVAVNVVTNDTDSDGTIDATKVDLNTATAGVQGSANNAQGSWAVNAQGVVTYTPLALFLGTATLNYTVMDNKGAVSNAASITITVQAINLAPVAVNDNVTTTKNKAVTIKVTQNDTDVDGSVDVTKVDLNPTLAGIQNTASTEQGDYSVNNQGVVTYTPATNFTGVAAGTYVVSDNAGATSNTATISITVQNVNSPPVATDDTGATSENTAVTVNVVSNDTDSDGVIDAAKVDLNTTIAGIQNSNDTPQGLFAVSNIGIVTYTPKKSFTGPATVNYTVSDNNNAVSNVAKITIAVQPANAPIANEDRATTKANEAVDINVVANDRDADGTIDVTTVDLNITTAGVQKNNTTPEGSFAANNEGIVTFTPKKDYSGPAALQYTVNDNKGTLSNAAAINITIQDVPDVAPEIIAFEDPTDTLRYAPGNPQQITEEFEARDVDDDSLMVAEIGFVSGSYLTGTDKLVFTNTSNIQGTFDEVSGLLTLSGRALIADYNNAVRSVMYEFRGTDESHVNIKGLYVRVSDGSNFSEIRQRAIKITSSVTDLDIPTAFTPNSDGANDIWRILTPTDINGSDFADAEIRVYDKRGTVVFGASGLANTWDGTYQGKQLPVDTYYYTIDLKQKQKRYKGIVAILR